MADTVQGRGMHGSSGGRSGAHPQRIGFRAFVILAGLVFSYIAWVNKPLERALGPRYAKRGHWSGFAVVPTLFAIVMLARDVFLTIRAFLGS